MTCALTGACAAKEKTEPSRTAGSTDEARPIAAYGDADGITLGEPLAAATDISGDAFVADGSPARLVRIATSPIRFVEFQLPSSSPGFYPTDVAVQGFFIFVVDETGRTILRFDKEGAYRDVLLNFDELVEVRRVSPYGIGVDGKGRIAISDIENHQILLFDGFLALDVVFGNYGSFAGQLNTPRGVSFTPNGDIVVADTGNKRIQFFTDTGTVKLIVPPEGAPNPLLAPRRVVVGGGGKIYVADPRAGRVFIFDDEGCMVGTLRPEGAVEFEPTDVEVAGDGALFVTDVVSRKLFVFKVM